MFTPATSPQTLLDRANAHIRAGDFAPARTLFDQVLKLAPNNPELHLHQARLCFELCDVDASLHHAERAAALSQDNPALLSKISERFTTLGANDAALDCLTRAAKRAPKALQPQADKAHLLQMLGQFDEAEKIFRKLIRKHPEQTELYRMFLGTTKLGKGDQLIRQMLDLWKHPRLNDQGRMDLGFALAKVMEDIGRDDRVFTFLNAANGAQRKLAPFDRQQRAGELAQYQSRQDGGDFTPLDCETPPRPIIVSGMPRSGTTLVETIIARHSDVAAGGELGHGLTIAPKMLGQAHISDIPPEKLIAWGARYQAMLRRDTQSTAPEVTDKAIMSHLIYGFLHRAIPGTRLIVVHRDPRDMALSIYKNLFKPGTHRYANDLADIAHVIKEFRAAITWWKTRMPDAIHEVHYEDLVSDPEPQIRALISAAGLAWQDACLNAGPASGKVKTLSLEQVRKPIHAGRKEAWRRFEDDLAPFITAWGDTPWR
jgi:hypothetical protein